MQPNEIDWSKAPDGATHWTHEARHHWLKMNADGQYYWGGGRRGMALRKITEYFEKNASGSNKNTPKPRLMLLHLCWEVSDGLQGS